MSNLKSTIEALASEFALSIIAALRSASIDELTSMSPGGGAVRRGPGRPPRAASVLGAGELARPALGLGIGRRGRPGRLGRRSASDIGHMVERIVAVLQANPEGLRAEQIRTQLACQAKELPRPLADALAGGRIRKTGQKRATTYFAAGGGGGSSGGESGAAPKKGRGGRRKRG